MKESCTIMQELRHRARCQYKENRVKVKTTRMFPVHQSSKSLPKPFLSEAENFQSILQICLNRGFWNTQTILIQLKRKSGHFVTTRDLTFARSPIGLSMPEDVFLCRKIADLLRPLLQQHLQLNDIIRDTNEIHLYGDNVIVFGHSFYDFFS